MSDIVVEMRRFISECWANVLSQVGGTVVYIDHYAAECLHWYANGKGFLVLKDAGAIAVHELDMYHFRYVEVKDARKAVIISTASDPAFYQRTIKMILAKNAFDSCVIYCGVPCCAANYPGIKETEEKLNYSKLKGNIKAWMASGNLSQYPLGDSCGVFRPEHESANRLSPSPSVSVEFGFEENCKFSTLNIFCVETEPSVDIIHIPLFIAILNRDLFVTPPFGDLMPSLDTNVSNDTLCALHFLANSFYKLFDSINARLDIYSLGKLSDRLAENLESYAVNTARRDHMSEAAEMGVSLILVDRTLDLCTPTSNSAESFLTKILRTFPRLPHHNNDVAIGMSPVFGTVEEVQRAFQVPGCLASVEKITMDLFILEKEKKLLAMANQSLTDMVPAKDSPKLRTARISGHSLEKVLGKIRATNSIDSTTVSTEKFQSILAIVEASTSQKICQMELLGSLEKLALQNLSVSRESSSILAQLSNVIRTRIHRGLDIENLLALLIHVYALAGMQIRFSTQQEHQLEESIANAILQDFQILKGNSSTTTTSTYQRTVLLLGGNETTVVRETSRRIAARIIGTLRLIAEQRSTLQDYRFSMVRPSSQEAIRYIGLLEQITRDVLCIGIGIPRELRDLRQRSSSLISAGFNLFSRGKAKRHPRDNPYIVIYVIGGVTAEEAKVIQEATLTHQGDKISRVILAGSRLLNPLDIVDKILFS